MVLRHLKHVVELWIVLYSDALRFPLGKFNLTTTFQVLVKYIHTSKSERAVFSRIEKIWDKENLRRKHAQNSLKLAEDDQPRDSVVWIRHTVSMPYISTEGCEGTPTTVFMVQATEEWGSPTRISEYKYTYIALLFLYISPSMLFHTFVFVYGELSLSMRVLLCGFKHVQCT